MTDETACETAGHFESLDVVDSQAPQTHWAPLSLLPSSATRKQESYPFQAMGKTLGDAAASLTADVPAPDSLVAGAVIAAASLAVQPHFCIELPDSRQVPMSLFVLTAVQDEDCAANVCDVVCTPIDQYRQQQAREFARECAEFSKARTRRGRDEGVPNRPLPRSIVVGDATVDELHCMLLVQSCASLFTSDGSEVLLHHAMGANSRESRTRFLVQSWRGGPIDSPKGSTGCGTLLGRRLCVHLPVPPDLMLQALSDPRGTGADFLSCCLISSPSTLAGEREFRPVNPAKAATVVHFHNKVAAFLATDAPLRAGGDGYELQPRALVMADDAASRWMDYKRDLELRQACGASLSGVRAFATKGAELAARVAGIVQVFEDRKAEALTYSALECGIQLVNFYLAQLVRLTQAGVEASELVNLHVLAAWLQTLESPVPHAVILQRAPSMLRKRKAAGLLLLLAELERRGYVRRVGAAWEVRPT